MGLLKTVFKPFKKIGKQLSPFAAPLGFLLGGPIGGALGSLLTAGVSVGEIKRANRENSRAQNAALNQQREIIQAEEAKQLKKDQQEQAFIKAQRKNLFGKQGRSQTLFGSPVGIRDEFGQRTVLG